MLFLYIELKPKIIRKILLNIDVAPMTRTFPFLPLCGARSRHGHYFYIVGLRYNFYIPVMDICFYSECLTSINIEMVCVVC